MQHEVETSTGPSLTINSSTAVTLDHTDLLVYGTVNWNGGDIHDNGSHIKCDNPKQAGTGLFTTNTDGVMDDQSQGGDFTLAHQGQFTKTGGGANGANTKIAVVFYNYSLISQGVQVAKGMLILASSGDSTGEFNVSGGAELDFAGGTLDNPYTWDNLTKITGAGYTIVVGGQPNIHGNIDVPSGVKVPADNLAISDGTIQDAGTLTINNGLKWESGTVQAGNDGTGVLTLVNGCVATIGNNNQPCTLSECTLNINQGAIVNLSGPIDFQLQNGPQVNNSGTFNILDNSNITQPVGAGALIINSGIFSKTGGAGVSTVDVLTISSGTAEVKVGKINWKRGFVQLPLASLLVDPGAAAEVDVKLEEDGGTITVTSATLTVIDAYLQTGGDDTITGGSLLSVTGTYEQDAGTMTIADPSSQLTTSELLNLAGGTLTLDGGTLTAGNGTQVGVAALMVAAGTIHGDVTAGGDFDAITTAGESLALNGNFNQAGGTTNVTLLKFTISDNLMLYAGAFDVNGGDVIVSASLPQTGGTLTINGGGLSVLGSFSQQGGDDTVAQGGGGGGTGGLLDVSGSYEQDAGTMTVADPSSQLTTSGLLNLVGGTLTVDGGTLDPGGGIQVGSAAVLAACGTITHGIATAGELDCITANGVTSLALNGGLEQSAGIINGSAGGFTIDGGLVQDGGLINCGLLNANGGAVLNGGAVNLGGGTLNTGTSGLQINAGGLVTGVGTLGGNVTNAGSIVVGSATQLGTVTVGGNYSQSGSLSLAVASDGTCDHLSVGGTANLGGSLGVSAFENETLHAGVAYTLVSAASLGGTFASVSTPPLNNGTWVMEYTSDSATLLGQMSFHM